MEMCQTLKVAHLWGSVLSMFHFCLRAVRPRTVVGPQKSKPSPIPSNVREEPAGGKWRSQAFFSSTARCSGGFGVRPDGEEPRLNRDVENVWKLEGAHVTQVKWRSDRLRLFETSGPVKSWVSFWVIFLKKSLILTCVSKHEPPCHWVISICSSLGSL